ncbi:hypothetical protein [Flavobacterium sp. UBA6031]|uniref:hypothetical protein n=1 Tax=Flavobacterium sp. UBA6031 TaxID=1946551 RepID=UPI0025C08E1A|nr:hypothetical protein [Flavobacterium sp. UBA6031]
MLQFVCHPALENLLTTSKEGMSCVTLTNNAVLISDFLPKASQPIHAGLLEAVKYRLFHPSEFIFITSFFPKEKLHPFDTYGILSLTGTEFIRLPFHIDQFLATLEENKKTEFNLSKIGWETFAIRACKALLKEKLSVLKHGGKLQFVDAIDMGLRWEVDNCLNDSLRIPYLITKLSKLQSDYQNNNEFVELVELCIVGDSLPDEYIQVVSGFVNGLNQIAALATAQEIDLKALKNNINELMSNFLKIETL